MARPALAPIPGAEEVRAELRRRLSRAPQKCVAYDLGVSQPVLSLISSGRREPSDRIAEALGFRRIIRFERAE